MQVSALCMQETEADRLRLDQEARDGMEQYMKLIQDRVEVVKRSY